MRGLQTTSEDVYGQAHDDRTEFKVQKLESGLCVFSVSPSLSFCLPLCLCFHLIYCVHKDDDVAVRLLARQWLVGYVALTFKRTSRFEAQWRGPSSDEGKVKGREQPQLDRLRRRGTAQGHRPQGRSPTPPHTHDVVGQAPLNVLRWRSLCNSLTMSRCLKWRRVCVCVCVFFLV